MAVSYFLIFTAVVLSVAVLVVSFILVVQFGHPDDRNAALFPKMITVMGLFLAFATILTLPFDIANARGAGGGLRMDILWQIILVLIILFVTVIVPFAFFFYESDDDPGLGAGGRLKAVSSQAISAMQYTLIFVAIFGIFLGVSSVFLSEAEIPIHTISKSGPLFNTYPYVGADTPCGDTQSCVEGDTTWNIPVSILVYCVSCLSFIGWFFFSLFLGIGFVALPFDLVNEFRTRPVPMKADEYARQKVAIGKRATSLLQIAQDFQKELTDPDRKESRKNKRNDREISNRIDASLHLLKHDQVFLEQSYIQKGGNPLVYFAKLFAGCIGGMISLTWVLHVCVYLLPAIPASPFLNTMFINLEDAIPGFSLFGVVMFGMYSFYLLWCCVKGNFRLGLRIPCLLKIYPMEIHNTMMNAFLFNTELILICTIPTVQFCVLNLGEYARSSDVRSIFGTQMRYLKFFKIVWGNNLFIYALLIVTLLTFLYIIVNPKDKGKEIDLRLKELVSDK